MELSELIPTSQPMPLVLPDGSDSGIVLEVVGRESDRFHDVSFKWAQRMQAREDAIPLQEMRNMQADLIASLIVGWKGLTEKGTPVPYSHEKAVELVKNPGLTFLKEQVEAFADRRTNFFRQSASAVDLAGEATDSVKHSTAGRSISEDNSGAVPQE